MTGSFIVRVLWVGLIGAAVVNLIAWALRRRSERVLLERLRGQWGQAKERDRDFAAISDYHRTLTPAEHSLDDRTWEDLNLDAVFTVLDRTSSVIGQQVFYDRLRQTSDRAHLDAFEALVAKMSTDAPTREQALAALSRLRDPAGYDVWRLSQPGLLELEPWHVMFPVLAASMVVALAAVPFFPEALVWLAAGAVTSIVLRTTVASHLRVVVGPFRQVGLLLRVADTLTALRPAGAEALVGRLQDDAGRLSRLKRIAGWVSRQTEGSFDLGSVLFEYLNLFLYLDANAFFFGARELRARSAELLRVIAAVGEFDAATSVASYRASTTGWTRPVWHPARSRVVLSAIRHPLLADAVSSSAVIESSSGLIVTGSNMSGKSTFLRTVGVTAVLAQTINTCLADAYEAPRLIVKSCIGRSDDPATGKSYYLVEVDSVLALVKASEQDVPHLFLFDELFRGTNAVERIAAGEAVLDALLATRADGLAPPHVVIAATHDRELVEYVSGLYAAYHFSESVGDGGLAFDYQLRPGSSTSRNAIALLTLRGAPDRLVSRATARAAALDRARA